MTIGALADEARWNIGLAVEALRANRLRSGLSILGIVIGIASVVLMTSLGRGLRSQILGSVEALGVNMVTVWPSVQPGGEIAPNGRLTLRDVRLLERSAENVGRVSGQLHTPAVAVAGDVSEAVTVVGVDEGHAALTPVRLEAGRAVEARDVDAGRTVVVLDAELAERLFDTPAAVERRLKLNGVMFTVIGVTASNGGRSDGGVTMPITTLRKRLARDGAGAQRLTTILVELDAETDPEAGKAEVNRILREARRLRPKAPDPFVLTSTAEFARQSGAIVRSLQVGLIGIAAISLVVGGVGVMNIMLVTVSERTREIGIRAAVGARPRDIRAQFLTEAATLCFIGGLLGVVLGVVLSEGVRLASGWETRAEPGPILLALAVSMSVGMLAGFIPARKAATLPPVVAIRHD